MILTVGNTKGGVGKTTLAFNIAVARALAGRDVLLVDGDEQGSAQGLSDLRAGALGAAGYTAVPLRGVTLKTQVRQLRPKYEDIVIDVGGRDSGSLRAALLLTDVLLIPVQPRTLDVWALDNLKTLLDETRTENEDRRDVVLINAADAQGRDNEDAAAAVKDLGLELLPVQIGRRKAFSTSSSMGRSVIDATTRDPKAIEELQALLGLLYNSHS